MRGICVETEMNKIDEKSAIRTILLTRYFRAMESYITPEMEVGVLLDLHYTELLSFLPQSFTTSEAIAGSFSIPFPIADTVANPLG